MNDVQHEILQTVRYLKENSVTRAEFRMSLLGLATKDEVRSIKGDVQRLQARLQEELASLHHRVGRLESSGGK